MEPPELVLMERARESLRTVFGFDRFRPGQAAVVEALLQGRSALAIFPTGAGKSLCYQLPALLLDGLTLVVSPLIALMKDQIGFLRGRGIAAARLDSSLGRDETRAVHDDLRAGRLRLLFVAPERFQNERFVARLRRQRLALLVIDESHCISEWGHNFRPDYLKLAGAARELGVERTLALTATATPEVAADIRRAFAIAEDDTVNTGFYRPNLTLRVHPCAASARDELLVARLRARPPGSAIVYVTLQRTAEQVAERLVAAGFPARPYHAGMESDVRNATQDWFMAAEDGVVVATIAFGMGIDKADIRAVFHYNLPKSLENYAQEIGRAGRDGRPSTCEVLASPDDLVTLENFTYGDTPTREAVRGVVEEVLGQGDVFDVSKYELARRHDVRVLVVATLLTYLELEGVIRATAPFYSGYRFQPHRSSAEILAGQDEERAGLLRRLLARAEKGRTWFALDLEAAARALDEPRERLVDALSDLEEAGDLTLRTAGFRQGYRRTGAALDVAEVAGRLAGRFEAAERRDLERIGRVLALAAEEGCRVRHLLDWFGEDLGRDCGHCDRCLGEPVAPLPERSAPPVTAADRRAIGALREEGHDALATPRQLARFLCGLSSPATTRGRPPLTRDARFGRLGAVPFATVLREIEAVFADG